MCGGTNLPESVGELVQTLVLRAGYSAFPRLSSLVLPFRRLHLASSATSTTPLGHVVGQNAIFPRLPLRRYAPGMSAKEISTARKRRGVAKASITRLAQRLKDLEARPGEPNVETMAQQMLKNIEVLNSDFKTQHLALIDLLDNEGSLEGEQEALDKHDELVTMLIVRIHALTSSPSSGTALDPSKVASRRLSHLRKAISSVTTAIRGMESDPRDKCLVRQREEQLREMKQELGDVSRSLLSLDLAEEDELMTLHSTLESELFEQSLKLKRMLANLEKTTTSATSDGKGIRLPRIDVPKFMGSILHWSTFWEQFSVSIHSRSDLADSEKLVYLRQSVKDGTARQVIEGLSWSGDQYDEAIE